MTILSALVRLYDRLHGEKKAPEPGFSFENISFALVIDREGKPLRLADLRSLADRNQPKPVPIAVPEEPGIRTSGIKPNRFWDNTAYVFGVTSVEEEDDDGKQQIKPGQGRRTAAKHKAFVDLHIGLLRDTSDPGLRALRLFLENWTPDQYDKLGWSIEALDQNLVFEFDDGSGPKYIHDRRATRPFLIPVGSSSAQCLCLITGETGPRACLHPQFKGIRGAQSSGAPLISFNKNAYESLGKKQGDNAPISERAAFAYGTALKTLLKRESVKELERHLQVGDTTVVFWAEADEAEAADFHKVMMGAINPPDNASEGNRLRAMLENVAQGRATDSRLDRETRVYMLGLAPNAGRLSVRFWYPGSFGDFADNVCRFRDDLRLEPAPWKGPPAVWSLLYETAIQTKTENRKKGKAKPETIPPLLGGELMRAVLTGKPLPRILLSAIVRRIRADGNVNGHRAAICKAVVNRTINPEKEMIPVSLDPESTNTAYCLGRLFAAFAYAEKSLADRGATIRDKYLAGASATPARVFPLLMRGYENNRSGLLKATDKRKGSGIRADRSVAAILEKIDGAENLPVSLSMEDQARFFVGFYHQWSSFFDTTDAATKAATDNQVLETTE